MVGWLVEFFVFVSFLVRSVKFADIESDGDQGLRTADRVGVVEKEKKGKF